MPIGTDRQYLKELRELREGGVEFPPNLSKLKNFRKYERNLQLFLHTNLGPKEIVVNEKCWTRVISFIEWNYENQSFRIEYEYNCFRPNYTVRGKVTLTYWIDPDDDIGEKVREILEKREELIKETFVIQN